MKNLKILTLIGALFSFGFGSAPSSSNPPKTVKYVDLNRYQGVWYDLAHLPQSFQKGCSQTSAKYTSRVDGKIEVLNRCLKNGQWTEAKGTARVVDTKSNAKLKVSFFWPFEGDYWVLDLDPNYEYAAVGSPDRKSFWVLSRRTSLESEVYEKILNRARAQGFDLTTLEVTEHR